MTHTRFARFAALALTPAALTVALTGCGSKPAATTAAHTPRAAASASPSTTAAASAARSKAAKPAAEQGTPIPNSNGRLVMDAGAQVAIAQIGQAQFDKEGQWVDMFVGVAHGDCGRLAGDASLAEFVIAGYFGDPYEQLHDNPGAAVLMPKDLGHAFPASGCSGVGSPLWTVHVEGGATPMVWWMTTETSTLYPTDGKPFNVTQTFKLGVVPDVPASSFRINAYDISKPQISQP